MKHIVERPRLALMLFMSILYTLTLQPGVGWGDVAKLQHEAYGPGIQVPLAAGLHPWHHLAAQIWEKIIPFGETAWRQNLLSALFALGALWSFMSVMYRLGVRPATAAWGALVLGTSHVFWTMAVWAESYSLFCWWWVLAIGQIMIYLKDEHKEDLCKAMFWLGIGMGNNLLQPFVFPALGLSAIVFFNEARRPTYWLRPCMYFVLGLAPLLVRVGVAHWHEGVSWLAMEGLVFDKLGQDYLFWKYSVIEIFNGMKIFPILGLYQFGLALFVLFYWKKTNSSLTLFMAFLMVTIFLFCSTFMRPRAMILLLAAWVPLSMYLTTLYEHVPNKWRCWGCVAPVLTIAGYLAVVPLGDRLSTVVAISPVGDRDPVDVFFTPWKHNETSAVRFLDDIERLTSPGDILITDFTPGAPITYAQKVEGRLRDRDIRSLSPNSRADLAEVELGRTVWLTRFNGPFKELIEGTGWSVERIDTLWRVVAR